MIVFVPCGEPIGRTRVLQMKTSTPRWGKSVRRHVPDCSGPLTEGRPRLGDGGDDGGQVKGSYRTRGHPPGVVATAQRS